MDVVVFDIETQNFFTDPGVGWDNFAALRISGVGAYSYARDKYFFFEESQIAELVPLFAESRLLVGFSINRYDVPVLNLYFERLAGGGLNLWGKERFDLLEEIEMVSGQRVSLSKLAEANLGVAKDRHGSEAIELYRSGRMAELREYCLKDVELTKQLYDLYREKRTLLVPDKQTGELVTVRFESRNAPTAHLF